MQTRKTQSPQFFLLFLCFILSISGSAVSAEEPLLVTISKETTRITAPLKDNGYPDYVGALNAQLSKGITAENNLVVAIWNTIGTTGMSQNLVNPYFKHLQTSPPKKNAQYYQSYYQWFQETLLTEEKTSELTPREIDGLRQSLEKEHEDCMQQPWTAKKFPRMAQWLGINQRLLVNFASAANSRSQFYNPYVVESEYQNQPVPELIGLLLPAAQQTRGLARGLRLLANNQIAGGNLDKAIETSKAIHRLGRLSSRGATLVEGLVGIAVDRMAFSLDELIINHEGVLEAHLKLLGDNILALPPISKLADKIDVFERYTFLDATITIARNGPQTLSSLTNGNSPSPTPALNNILKGVTTTLIDWDHILRSGNYWYDEIKRVNSIKSPQQRKVASKTLAERITAQVRAATEPTTIAKQVLFSGKSLRTIASSQVASVLAGLMLPALDAVIRVETRGIATQRVTLTGIAITRYKLHHNRYPDNLSAIKGIYLDELPTDPFTDRPLKYQRLPQGFAVYSFGGNMTDDQGLSRADANKTNSEADDIIFRVGNKTKQPDHSQ